MRGNGDGDAAAAGAAAPSPRGGRRDRPRRRRPASAATARRPAVPTGDRPGTAEARSRPASALHTTKHAAVAKRPPGPSRLARRPASAPSASDRPASASGLNVPPVASPPPAAAPRDTVFRALVETRLAGLLIGKSGATINAIRAATSARVRVIDPLPHAPERVAVISSTDGAAARAALLRVHDAHVAARNAVDGASPAAATLRLLICRSQAGACIGRGGAGLAALRAQTGAVVFVHPPNDLVPAALVTDRLVSISGEDRAVRDAAVAVADILAGSPPTVRPGLGVGAAVVALPPPQPPPPPVLYHHPPPPPMYYPPWPPPPG